MEAHLKAETVTALQRSLTAAEELLAARQEEQDRRGRLDLRIPDLLRAHEQRLATLRRLAEAVDEATREALQLDRLLEAELTRFKRELLALTTGQADTRRPRPRQRP